MGRQDVSRALTLRAHEDQRHVADVAIVVHLRVVLIDRLEALLVLQTEDEDHRVDPVRELNERGVSDPHAREVIERGLPGYPAGRLRRE